MKQQNYVCVTNLGDVNPLDYGGLFVFVDPDGESQPFMEKIEPPCEDQDDQDAYTVWRTNLDQCTFMSPIKPCASCMGCHRRFENPCPYGRETAEGILSDNEFHPGYSAWFATPERERQNRNSTTYLSNVYSCMGMDQEELVGLLVSSDPVDRARGYQAIYDYHGWDEADNYPETYTRKELERRYRPFTTFTVVIGGSDAAKLRWPDRTYKLRSSAKRRMRQIANAHDQGVSCVYIMTGGCNV